MQTHRGIPRLNRSSITQVIESRSAVLGHHSENLGNKEKSNMKMG